MGKKKFPKYQVSDVAVLALTTFGKLEQGNLFYMKGYKHETLLIVTNERKDIDFDRNCTVIVAKDKGYCGLSFWLEDSDEVYVVEDTNIILRSYSLL